MLINQKTNTSLNENELFLAGVLYLNSSQRLLAYAIFKQLVNENKNPSVALLYNMALCHLFAKEYEKTILTLNQAIQQMAVPSSSLTQADVLPETLLIDDYASDAYLFAISETTINLHAIIKLRIRRILLDANFALENWQEVIRLAALPEMNKCKNVTEATDFAKIKPN